FVHDRETDKTTRVNVRSNGDQAEGGLSSDPSISANGRFVAFTSEATNLVVGVDDNGYSDVFIHDRETKKTTRVSVRYNGDQAEGGHSYNPTLSGSGRFVAFQSVVPLVSNDNNDLNDIFVRGPLR
ncbi:MAG TPA: calcium-binding protein, partial [Actinomycetota bacterium]|nr:calcium-binding protein [Actinomycetota bacterium]